MKTVNRYVITDPMVRGYQTSEFWITLGSLISTMAATLFGVLPPKTAGVALGLMVLGYGISRGMAKQR